MLNSISRSRASSEVTGAKRLSSKAAPRGSARCGVGGSREIARLSNAEEMESRARHSSRVRSCAENSGPATSEAATADDELCGRGDIGIGRSRRWLRLAAAAENKGAAAALGDAPVNLRPERGKIIDGGNQRDADHEPDRDI